MIAKKGDQFRPVFTQPDGSVFVGRTFYDESGALTDSTYVEKLSSLKTLEIAGWEIMPLTRYNLTAGDIIENDKGYFRRILNANGYGQIRCYSVSCLNRHVKSDDVLRLDKNITASQLGLFSWKPVQPTQQEQITAEEASKRLGVKVVG